MTIEAIQSTYLNKLSHFSEILKKTEKKIKIISYSRLSLALLSVLSFYLALTQHTDFFYLLIFLILAFSVLAFFHNQLFRKRDWIHNSLQINKDELKYLNQNYSPFDTGNEYINFTHPYSFDLDLFGKDSLYQSLCRSVTFHGKTMLAEALSNPELSEQGILSKQECIKELKEKIDFRQNFQATGLLLKETPADREKLKQWLSEDVSFVNAKALSYLRFVLPSIASVFVIISIIQWQIHPLLLLTLICNWILYGTYAKKINRLYFLISKKKMLLDNYSDLLKIAHEESVSAGELVRLRTSFQDGAVQYKKLANYVGWFDQRLNILVSPFLNSIFLFDIQCCYLIEKWKIKNDSNVLSWMDGLGKLDLLCSLGNFAYNNPDFTFPEMSKDRLSIQAIGMAHPLIKSSKRIPNDFEIGNPNHTAIITGANMAGKSTFLRTLGINVVLAHLGAPVCATYFKCSLLQLISSMRISDSLKDDVSYFYAELQRLKSIKENAAKGSPTLILLDEMLRGTNSKDKQLGSKGFVENLLQYKCLVIVATHDLLLGQLEDEYPDKIKNFSFESFLQDNQLIFDYKIRSGVAQNTNASFLMKNLGIIN